MGFNFWKWISGGGSTTAPPPTPIPADTVIHLRILGVTTAAAAALRTDDGAVAAWDLAGNVFTFTLPGTVPPHGATIVVAAEGYERAEPRLVLQPGRTTWLPDLTLTRIPVPAIPRPPEPAPPVPVSADAVDLRTARVAARDCPDVRGWPVGASITSFTLADRERFERGNTMIEFAGRDALPPAMGSQGAISYTLWIGCALQGHWYLLPIVECIKGYVPTGPLLDPGHMGPNLLYYADPPLHGYQPAPREMVLFFATTGDTRRQNVQAPGVSPWRTNVICVPFAVGHHPFAALVH
jgi:hypothetical protein